MFKYRNLVVIVLGKEVDSLKNSHLARDGRNEIFSHAFLKAFSIGCNT